jgi:hypothetical protein
MRILIHIGEGLVLDLAWLGVLLPMFSSVIYLAHVIHVGIPVMIDKTFTLSVLLAYFVSIAFKLFASCLPPLVFCAPRFSPQPLETLERPSVR